jgi:hypothetical protein
MKSTKILQLSKAYKDDFAVVVVVGVGLFKQ